MSGLAKILIVEDDASLAQQFKWYLKNEHSVSVVSTREDAIREVQKSEYHVALLDLGLPPHPENPTVGLSLLQEVVKTHPSLKVIVITAHGDQQTAREALGLGSYDFLVKPVDERLLDTLIKRAFYRQKLEAEFWEGRRHELPVPMVVASDKIKQVIQTAREIAALPVSCLILGETGTGKELIAQTIHRLSCRKSKALIVVECSSIPLALGEAELFGAEKGSYTGSIGRREGRISQAEKGTLFLDEVGELTLELQAKLLRFLETREFTPIGGKTSQADVRIIAATNRNLPEEVNRGRFRLDLYHRLCQVEITIPPLRERQEEIVPLATNFLSKLAHEFRMTAPPLTSEAERALTQYSFPGNIRELKNLMSRAMIVSKGRPIGIRELSLGESPENTIRTEAFATASGFDLPRARAQLERQWIEEAINRHKGKISAAAEDLAVPRPTLYDLMKKYRLHGSSAGGKAKGTGVKQEEGQYHSYGET